MGCNYRIALFFPPTVQTHVVGLAFTGMESRADLTTLLVPQQTQAFQLLLDMKSISVWQLICPV